MRSSQKISLGLVLAFLFTLTGCAPSRVDDPLARMLDRNAGLEERRVAGQQAREEFGDDPRHLEVLRKLVYDRGYPHWQRQHAIDELIRLDGARFREELPRRIVLIQNWETIHYLFDQAVKYQWDDFTPVVVRQYARHVHGMREDERPERKVLEQLNPGRSIEEIVFDEFVRTGDEAATNQQVAAWELLCRITDSERLIELLDKAPETTALVVDLKAAGRDLHAIPVNREGVLWLSRLRTPDQAELWRQATARVASLKPEQRVGLQLRHIPVLLALDDAMLAADRATLHQRVTELVQAAETHLTSPTYDGGSREYSQRFRDYARQFTWADLATIQILFQAVTQPDVARSLFEQADADHQDKSTEFGGLIQWHEGRFRARAYAPLYRNHDYKFLPTDVMIRDMYTSLAHYHFHAQRYTNSDHAGPGLGDLKLVNRLNFNGLVFTFINRDTLNIDYYQPGGAVVDLGVIRR